MSYTSVHARIRRCLGPASAQTCARCGARAAEWALTPGSPRAVFDRRRRLWYSTDLRDYQAACRRCHARDRLPHRPPRRASRHPVCPFCGSTVLCGQRDQHGRPVHLICARNTPNPPRKEYHP